MKPTDLTPEFILSEVKKLQYLYGLKREIRYGQSRPEHDLTESVAEHIYGMHLLAHYFLPLENPAGDWDAVRILSMITIHDLDEIETGDTIGYLKTPDMRATERNAQETVINNSPQHLQTALKSYLDEYDAQNTFEAQFVKAIDRFEPLVQMYSEFGRAVLHISKSAPEHNVLLREQHLQPFPTMYRYYQVIHQTMVEEGYFIQR